MMFSPLPKMSSLPSEVISFLPWESSGNQTVLLFNVPFNDTGSISNFSDADAKVWYKDKKLWIESN